MGKSFWAHALLDSQIRHEAAKTYRQPLLASLDVEIGYNASDLSGEIAPPRDVVTQALSKGVPPEDIWRTVLLRAARKRGKSSVAGSFVDQCKWVGEDVERFANEITRFDAQLSKDGRKLLLIFDALDVLGSTWAQAQTLSRALLSRALSAKSYSSIRFKLFMRPDQYADTSLFTFADASKIKNDRVDLAWQPEDLYGLLFQRLLQSQSPEEFKQLMETALGQGFVSGDPAEALRLSSSDDQKTIVDLLAGEFMGSTAKRGRVYTWLPTHLGDAAGQTSPRTFLTAWQVAATHGPAPADKAVDHLGLTEGVRKASEDRLSELQQDYPWITQVLQPLAGESVPMPWSALKTIWSRNATVEEILSRQGTQPWLGPLSVLLEQQSEAEEVLLDTLCTIGVFERRSNDKVNVPDIFRVEARIKRRGGVKPPRGNS